MPTLTWPDIHGALTHFPIAMLLAGIVFDLGGVAFKKETFRTVGFWMLVIAVLGGTAALISGWINGGVWFPGPAKPPVFYQHRASAFWTIGLATVLLLVRIKTKDSHTGPALAATIVLGLMIAAAAAKTGYLGGKMALPDTTGTSSTSSQASGPSATGKPSATEPAPQPAMIAAGKTAFYGTLGCTGCHSIGGKGGKAGPDLTHEGSRQPSMAWQVAHMKNPQKTKPDSSMPPYDGTDPKTLSAIAAFLVSRK